MMRAASEGVVAEVEELVTEAELDVVRNVLVVLLGRMTVALMIGPLGLMLVEGVGEGLAVAFSENSESMLRSSGQIVATGTWMTVLGKVYDVIEGGIEE